MTAEIVGQNQHDQSKDQYVKKALPGDGIRHHQTGDQGQQRKQHPRDGRLSPADRPAYAGRHQTADGPNRDSQSHPLQILHLKPQYAPAIGSIIAVGNLIQQPHDLVHGFFAAPQESRPQSQQAQNDGAAVLQLKAGGACRRKEKTGKHKACHAPGIQIEAGDQAPDAAQRQQERQPCANEAAVKLLTFHPAHLRYGTARRPGNSVPASLLPPERHKAVHPQLSSGSVGFPPHNTGSPGP